MNSVIYHLQFGFTKNYSTSHALIHLTDQVPSKRETRQLKFFSWNIC